MSSLNLHHDFGNLAEEDWQEFAFSSVKDVHKLVRKTSEGYALKPLYTQNDTLEHSKLLKGLSYKKNKVLAPISSQKDYDQASELGVSHFQVGLNIEQLEVEEMPSLGREDQSFFISLHQNPIVEATYWKKRIAKYQKRYFLFDPVTHILKQQKITRSFDLLVDDMFEFSKTFKESFIVSVDGHYLKSLGLSDVSELSHILLVFKYYLEEARKREFSTKSLFSKAVFKIALGSSFFKNIAKSRATKLLLHRLFYREFQEIFEKDFVIISELNTSEIQDQDLHTNILRETTACFSSVMAHLSHHRVSAFDQSEIAKRVAINTHHILNDESHIQEVRDPSSGSYFLDQLTDQLVQQSWEYYLELEQKVFLQKYFFSGEFAKKCKEDETLREKKTVIGVTQYKNTLDSSLNRDSSQYEVWEKYDSEKIQGFKKIDFSQIDAKSYLQFSRDLTNWQNFKDALGYIEFFSKPQKEIALPPLKYGGQDE